MSDDILEAQIIVAEALAVLRDNGEKRLHPGVKIALASIALADDEGVATMRPKQLQRWCGRSAQERAGAAFVDRQIEALIEAGVLAPGSTALELRSMLAYRAEAETTVEEQGDEQAAA